MRISVNKICDIPRTNLLTVWHTCLRTVPVKHWLILLI